MGENLRKKEVTTASGKDVRDTSQLSGSAKRTSAEGEKNETTQYTTKGSAPGPYGGENTNS